jgi:hypothetical protein
MLGTVPRSPRAEFERAVRERGLLRTFHHESPLGLARSPIQALPARLVRRCGMSTYGEAVLMSASMTCVWSVHVTCRRGTGHPPRTASANVASRQRKHVEIHQNHAPYASPVRPPRVNSADNLTSMVAPRRSGRSDSPHCRSRPSLRSFTRLAAGIRRLVWKSDHRVEICTPRDAA